MSRANKDIGYVALRIEGGILPAEFMSRVAALDAPKQAASDYKLSKGLTVKDEIGRAWRIALSNWRDYRDRRQREGVDPRETGIDDWLLVLLREVLGYSDMEATGRVHVGERGFPVSHRFVGGAVPLVAATFDFELDKGDPAFGDEGRRRSPHGALQEYLNAEDLALWGLVGNGSTLRLLRDNPSLTRPAYIEADLERMFEEQLYADFAAFWLIFHASRLTPANDRPDSCILESWREVAQETGERALANLREGVTTALRELGCGFLEHPGNDALRDALKDGSLTTDRYFQELLRLIYRLLFLFTAEDRNLLHSPETDKTVRDLYGRGYAVGLLRERAGRRRHYDDHADLWAGLQVTFRSLVRGAAPLGLPALGGLFAPDQCARLDAGTIANRRFLKAVHALCFFPTGRTLARINYRDMDTEELGSVYESLLELHPLVDVDTSPWRFGFVGDDNGEKAKGSERKLSGSYYTPDSLVQELIKSALEPVMERALRDHPENPRQALLDLRIIDPACGSGHFLLAAARRVAAEIARLEAGEDTADEAARQHALREVVQHCIYGVDRNPLSVELCKTALWIETVEPGSPLTFLDSHIRMGDSLIGVFDLDVLDEGIPDEAYKALTGDAKDAASHYRKLNATVRKEKEKRDQRQDAFEFESDAGALADAYARMDAMPEEESADIDAKRTAYEALHGRDGRGWQLNVACDLWTAAFFTPKTEIPSRGRETVPTSDAVWRYLRQPNAVYGPLIAEADRIAYENRFFHWPVEFPDIFVKGGFDVVLGNPPWEVSQLNESEYFAARLPSVAAKAGNARKTAITALEHEAPAIWAQYQADKRRFEAANGFVRACHRFDLTASGKINSYALFAELFLNAIAHSGRSGVIVPTGIATDNSTKAYFDEITSNRRLASLFDFENREAIFPGVHRSYKFALVTLGHNMPEAEYVFFATETAQLRDPDRRFTLSPEDIALINPNTRTCPVFRSQADAELTKKIYRRVPVLIDETKGEASNPWDISFRQGLFNMTSDSGLFRTFRQLQDAGARRDGMVWIDVGGKTWVPLYEAKMFHQFDHRWATYEEDGYSSRDLTDAEKTDAAREPLPRYWVPELEVKTRLDDSGWNRLWLMGLRGIARATDERTVIVGNWPYSGVGNSAHVWTIQKMDEPRILTALQGSACSLILDFVARQKVGGTNLNFFYVEQFPILPPDACGPADVDFIAPRVLELTYTSHSMQPFAEDLGYDGPPFAWDPERRALLRAELDAYYAYLYGLTRDELRYILDPADVKGPDYPSETFRVLQKNEIKQFGEYRTRRLVLEAWDRFVEDGTFAPERLQDPAYVGHVGAALVKTKGHLAQSQKELAEIRSVYEGLLALAEKSPWPTLFVEGETDVPIIEAAWSAFFPDEALPVNIISAGGTVQMGSLVGKGKALREILGNRLVCALADNDSEGRGLWDDGHFRKGGKWRQHSNGIHWCLLQPTDEFVETMKRFDIPNGYWPFTIEACFPAALRRQAADDGAYPFAKKMQAELMSNQELAQRMFGAMQEMDPSDDANFYLMAPHTDAKIPFAEWITAPERRTRENYAAFEGVLQGLKDLVERHAAGELDSASQRGTG